MSSGVTTPSIPNVQAEPAVANDRRSLTIVAALLTVYIVWGTTYLAIRFALESFPPFMMMSIRFLIAGSGMFVFLRLRGMPMPTASQWRSSFIVGALLLGGGMGIVALAEKSVSSGLTATLVATSPLWAMLFGLRWGNRPRRVEWFGVVLGLIGVALLTLEGDLR